MAFGVGSLARPVAAVAACALLSASAASRFDAASERIRLAFAGSEGSFQRERAAKRLEIARRLEGPRFSAVPTQEDELAAFGAYFEEEISLWRSFPLNPDVSPRRLSVADFGAEGDGVADDAPAFASAIAAVKALNGEPAVLEVPAGTYFLKDCGLANCASSAHVVLSGCTNLVLSGASPETTHFVLGDDMKPGIDVVDSCNVSVRNIDVYWKKTPFTQGRIESYDVGRGELVIRLQEGTLRPDDPYYGHVSYPELCCSAHRDDGSIVLGGLAFWDMRSEDLGGGLFKLFLATRHENYRNAEFPVGAYAVIPARFSKGVACHIDVRSRYCSFDSVWVRNAPAAAFIASGAFSTGYRCRVFPLRPEFKLSTNADAFYNACGSHVSHCEFRGMNDDAANSHTRGKPLVSQLDDHTLVHGMAIDRDVRPGETMQVFHAHTGRVLATLHAESSVRAFTNGSWIATTRFREKVPDGILAETSPGVRALTKEESYALTRHGGDMASVKIADYIYQPLGQGVGYVVYDNVFRSFRGIAVNSQCPNTLVEGNVIENVNNGVQLSALMDWHEGVPPHNVVIRGNSFRNVRRGVATRFVTVSGLKGACDPFVGVAVVSNSFEDVLLPLATDSAYCRDIEVSGNYGPTHGVFVRDAMRPPALRDVVVGGRVGEMQGSFLANRVFSDFARREIWKEAREAFEHPDDDMFKSPVGMWKGEFWGKLMISACRAAEYSGDTSLKEFLHDEGLRLAALQQPDGYLGTYVDREFVVPRQDAGRIRVPGTAPDWNWNLWCRKYTLWGLLYCYRLTGDRRLLDAADRAMAQQIAMLRRLGLKLCDTGTTSMRGLPPCSILKPLLWLGADTGKKEYFDYAREIVGYWDEDGNRAPQFFRMAATGRPMYDWYPSEIGRWGKAYEMMSCLDGLLEFYRAIGEKPALELVKTLHGDIRENETNPCLSVGYNDQFTGAARHLNGVTEPCDAVHWMRLNHDLFVITGDPSYVDAFELAFYNAFLAAMRPDGKWAARCVRSHWCHQPAPPQSGMTLQHCCVNNLPRGFMDAAQTVVATAQDGVVCVCLYHDAVARMSGTEVEISGGYPVRDDVFVKVRRDDPGKVRFRVPAWCEQLSVEGGEGGVRPGGDGWLEAPVKAGETMFSLRFGLRPRIVDLNRTPFVPGATLDLQSGRWGLGKETLRQTPAAEVMYGPLLLAKSVKVGDTAEEIVDAATVKGGGWSARLVPRSVPEGVWAAWTLLLEKGDCQMSVGVCDFPSAAEWKGNGPEFSVFF